MKRIDRPQRDVGGDLRTTPPDFVVIGEQKCGTGWIRDRLSEHPDVFMHNREINFFCRRDVYARGVEWYSRQFGPARSGQIRGEKSPDYFWINSGQRNAFKDPLTMIRRDLPQVKTILSLRNPVDRAISAVNHHLRHRGRRLSPRVARKNGFLDLVFGSQAAVLSRHGVLERGFYATRLEHALRVFGEGLLVLIFEEAIVDDPKKGLAAICRHIGVDDGRRDFSYRENRKARQPSYGALRLGYLLPVARPAIRRLDRGHPFRLGPTQAERLELSRFYREDIDGVEDLLGVRLRGWKR